MKVTDIYEAMNSKAEAFFEWVACPMACRVAVPLEMGM